MCGGGLTDVPLFVIGESGQSFGEFVVEPRFPPPKKFLLPFEFERDDRVEPIVRRANERRGDTPPPLLVAP